MKKHLLIFCISLSFLIACKSKQIVVETSENKTALIEEVNLEETPSFKMANLQIIDKQDLLFSILKTEILNQRLSMTVQYGGGCIDKHRFELVTDGIVTNNGVMEFYLLHKTHDDFCKALITEELFFDLEPIYKLESEVLKEINVNEKLKMTLN